jgi:hypothetical protein
MATKAQPFIRLRHQDKDAEVHIETEEEDRFVLTVGAAIQACKAFGEMEEFTKQFRKLRAKLTGWLQEHGEGIADAFLTVRDSALLLLVVRQSEAFHQEFEDALTDLDVAVAQDDEFSLIRLNVLGLPRGSEESIQSFLVSGSANL